MDTGPDKRRQVGEFLHSRRARVRPEDVGLESMGPRRVQGLRREELAQLAGVSVDYYVRLEQGRAGYASASVLDAIGRALQLEDAELAYLNRLSRPARRPRASERRVERVRPRLQRLLDVIEATPALIFGRCTDVLAYNRLAGALLTDFGALPRERRNLARLVFLDDGFRHLMVEWEEVARETVGVLRMAAGRHPDDPELAALVGELTLQSDDFRRWWSAHDVREKTHGTKLLEHPVVGPLTLAYETFRLPDDADQVLVTYYAAEGEDESDTALRLLQSWTVS